VAPGIPVVKTKVPRLFEEAYRALAVWAIERTPDTHERMVEAHDDLRWNENLWRHLGLFKAYRRLCRLLESTVDKANCDAREFERAQDKSPLKTR
jgi:hypothetical protein